MMLPLLLSLVVSGGDDPPVKVWLNHDNYFQRGDKARVNVRLADDGYVIVLRADADGRVRVLFPLDPSNDDFVRGHETIEVRSRGDREAFFVDDREGSGLVLAARSVAPFKFDEFVRGDHWDYRVLDARQAGDDKEAALVDMVQKMSPDGHFDYDAVTYVVSSPRAYYDSYYPRYAAVGFGYGYGSPYGYGYGLCSTCYDPFFYDPFLCYDPIFYRPYRFGFFGNPYRPFIFAGGGFAFFNRPFNRPHNTFINRVRTSSGVGVHMTFKDQVGTNVSTAGIGPRFRAPEGTLISRRSPETASRRERDAMQRGDRGGSGNTFPVRDRNDRPDRAQPADRDGSSGRRSAGNSGGNGGERRTGGGGGGGWSAPRGSGGGGGDRGVRSPPSNRGGGGGGGGGSHGNSGGGSRRRP